jgi:alkylation response protein AidB-like acyl-CoA dehydrogenase
LESPKNKRNSLILRRVFCRDKSPVDRVRALLGDDTGFDPEVWAEIAELGWLGIGVPEDFGGIGLGLGEVVPIVEQMGRALMAMPFVSSVLTAQVILRGGTQAQKEQYLPAIASGTAASLALMRRPRRLGLIAY